MSRHTPSKGNDSDAEGEPDLVALLGSRLCHDLVSPIGAIGNGLELLELSGGGGEEIALIRASLDAALARIAFFRLAFGKAGTGPQVSAREVQDVLHAMYRDTRTRIKWTDTDDHPRSEMRLACLALNCLEVATPWGATVEVSRNPNAWVFHVDAKRLKIDAPLWQGLGRGTLPDDLKGSEVQFGILARDCRRLRRPISVSADDSHLSLLV
ncbi:histidine phosphotransferase family protein [Jannaschia sp. M317]|uniref:histidine phosphotransferase family protein n=1 Tax=Jannaschia sp. M317 TaxID=2867011 RepID=UPI0021A7F9B3|nr:histidine phosphotransferase family protein [Jannaschia sp. M317]UWQ16546.1 histidine phosphotransferase [Jannaschia sp. M317]